MQNLVTSNQVIDELLSVDLQEYTREYELEIAKISQQIKSSESNFYLSKINELLENSPEKAYNIFYALCTQHRRSLNISKYRVLISMFEEEFSKFHSYKFLVHLGQKIDPQISSERILLDCKHVINDKKLACNPGIVHSYCECVAEFLDEFTDRLSSSYDLICDAISKMEVLISDDYAKYYCTYGRLLVLECIYNITDQHSESKLSLAIEQISKAIDLEDANNTSYSIRINQYQMHIVGARQRYYSHKLQIDIAVARKEFDEKTSDLNVRNMEFLGFFIGVISFTLGSLNLVTFDTFEQNAKLIVVLMGALMIAFSCFGFILYGFEKKTRIYSNSAVAFIGFLLLVFAPMFYN